MLELMEHLRQVVRRANEADPLLRDLPTEVFFLHHGNQSAGEVPELNDRQIHTLVTTQNYAVSNPEVLVAMTKAVFRAQQLIHSDLEATVDAIRSSDVVLQEPDGVETILAIYEPAIPYSPEVSLEGALLELELFYPAHLTPPDISAEEMEAHVDNQFAEQAIASSPPAPAY